MRLVSNRGSFLLEVSRFCVLLPLYCLPLSVATQSVALLCKCQLYARSGIRKLL